VKKKYKAPKYALSRIYHKEILKKMAKCCGVGFWSEFRYRVAL